MAGPLTIQRAPKGLLDLLAMKGSGALPTDLANELRGVIDTSYLYLQDGVRVAVGSAAGNATGAVQYPAAHIVPPGEVWVLNWVSMSTTGGVTTAGDHANALVYVIRSGGGFAGAVMFDGLKTSTTATLAQTEDNAGTILRPFDYILLPGDAWWMRLYNVVTTGNITVALNYGYFRLTF
jgi:hypothetical protein